MSEKKAKQVILVADRHVPLPEGVTVTDWGLERVRRQNPRIRALLGSLRLLDQVLESNYAILHCSPERLGRIWDIVREVASLVETRVGPLLAEGSVIPALHDACGRASDVLAIQRATILDEIGSSAAAIPAASVLEIRKLLCVSIGQIHVFLQDALGGILAADPRSVHDADYFLSRRFPRDVDEAEWLFVTVERLGLFLAELGRERQSLLGPFAVEVRGEGRLPRDERVWSSAASFLRRVEQELTPKLREVLALRGIRFSEMEVLDRYAFELPHRCGLLGELWDVAAEVRAATGAAEALSDRPVARRMGEQIAAVDDALKDLVAFVPIWLDAISKRRALLLRRGDDLDLSSLE